MFDSGWPHGNFLHARAQALHALASGRGSPESASRGDGLAPALLPHRNMRPPISKPALDASTALGSLRLQAAVVRALLDEVEERTPPPGTTDDLVEQLSDELERLGRGALQAAKALARCRASAPPVPESLREEVEPDPIPHWLPIGSF